MNQEAEGPASDRLFVSFHSNASAGATQRGVLGLWNNLAPGNNNTPTPNQLLLADTLGLEINDDLIAQAGQFGATNWFDRGSDVTLGGSFGEIDNRVIFSEFDATIMETGFHDNVEDAQMLRDPRVRDAIAKATYQGIIKFFRSIDGNSTPVEAAPAAVTHLRAESNAAGQVTVSWTPPVANSYAGDAADGYRIYASADGYGFDGGTFVAGEATSTLTLSGYEADVPYYFKVVAVNEGGESPDSEVLAATPSGGAKQVLIVSGFDRLDFELDPKQAVNNGPPVDRVRPRSSNSRDYTVQVGEAIEVAAPGVHVNSTSNEAVIAGTVNLADYDTVIWILGEESTTDDTFDAMEQTKVEQFIAGGGNLFLSGADIGWDLDAQNNGQSFYQGTLLANFVSDDANSYQANGIAGRVFAGLSLTFDDGSLFYDVDSPDVIDPQAGSLAALTYASGAGNAAIQAVGTGGRGSIVMLAFPFETITTAANQTAVMDRVLDFFAVVPPGAGGGAGGAAYAPLASQSTPEVSQEGQLPAIEMAQLSQFSAQSTIVGHSLDTPVLQLAESVSAEHADLAMLLLAAENDRSESEDDALAAIADRPGGDGASDTLDLVLAAAFEDETDWRLAL